MAGLTKEQRAEREAAKAAEQVDGLIEMNKNGETLHVHPSCVKAHEGAGWKVTA